MMGFWLKHVPYPVYFIFLISILKYSVGENNVSQENSDGQGEIPRNPENMQPTNKTPPAPQPEEIYQRLLRHKRLTHKEAVKTIVSMDNYEKQHKMITLLLDKLFKVMVDSQVQLMSLGFNPSDRFPVNDTIRDVYSQVIENTAFFGDLVLRLPDIVHDIMKKKKEWSLLIQWGISFCNMAEIFEKKDSRMLNLMSQELGIIDKDPSYTNPYKKVSIEVNMQSEEKLAEYTNKLLKKQKKKKQKESKKGPRLSTSRTDL